MKRFFLLQLLFCGIALRAHAAAVPVQRLDVVNMLWNSAATPDANKVVQPGLTPTSVLLKFYTSSGGTVSTTPCFTVTLPFEGSSTFFAGTGFACTTAVTTLSVSPVPNALLGSTAVYAAPANYTLTAPTDFSSQITIEQAPSTVTNYAPTFNTANATLTTPGNVVVKEQDAP